MKIDSRCAYCLLSIVHQEARLSTDNPEIIGKTMMAGLDALHRTFKPGSGSGTARMSTIVHRSALKVLNDDDPYQKKKMQSRQTVSNLMPIASSFVGDEISVDGFRRAVLAAIIGNTLDFGVDGFNVNETEFENEFIQLFHQGLNIDDTDKITSLFRDVVYLADNSGEILLDTLVFQQIKEMGGRVTLVVRGAPILNDATMEDVKIHGIDKIVNEVMTTGSNAIGVCLEEAPPQLLDAFSQASLIISKGMANYETMSEYKFRPMFYMLRIKCQVVADDLGLDKGMLIAKLVE